MGVYDATPALVTEFTVDYQYDEMGRMLRRDDGTDVTTYCWDGWDLWKETTGESVTEYLVPDGLVRTFLRNGEIYVTHVDALGSGRVVTDSEGAVVARVELGAWGQILAGSVDLVPGGLSMDFVGALGVRKDPLTGLTWMRSRWYDTGHGRFMSRDIIGLKGGPNQYVYCEGNPIDTFDPTGLQPPGYMRGRSGAPRLENCRPDYSNRPVLTTNNAPYGYAAYASGKLYPRSAQGYATDRHIGNVFSGLAAQQMILNVGGGVASPGAASAAAYHSMVVPSGGSVGLGLSSSHLQSLLSKATPVDPQTLVKASTRGVRFQYSPSSTGYSYNWISNTATIPAKGAAEVACREEALMHPQQRQEIMQAVAWQTGSAAQRAAGKMMQANIELQAKTGALQGWAPTNADIELALETGAGYLRWALPWLNP